MFIQIVHDLKNPLSIIKQSNKILKSELNKQNIPENLKNFFNYIENSTNNLLNSVNNILELKKVELNTLNTIQPIITKVELTSLLQKCVDNIKLLIG